MFREQTVKQVKCTREDITINGNEQGTDITIKRNVQGTDITIKRNVQGTDITSESKLNIT